MDIFQKTWTFLDILTCPPKSPIFSYSFGPKFEDLWQASRPGERIPQETIFEDDIPAGVQKKLSLQGLIIS